MKFTVRQNEIKKALEVIKDSKALGKSSDGDDYSSIRITAKNGSVSFLASNILVWSESTINETDDGITKDIFSVTEEGSIFVAGNDFISILFQFPKDSILTFCYDDKSDDKTMIVECADPSKKGRARTSKFLVTSPSYFEENSPEEERTTTTVSPVALKEAIESVEFATSTDEEKQYLWGVHVEIFAEDEVSACASDRVRIVWYDKKGCQRDTSVEPFKINAVKQSLVPALKHLNNDEPLVIEKGERYTILRQKNQWHGIPNAAECGDGESLPQWRSITSRMNDACQHVIKVPREMLLEFIKAANSTQGGKYGINIAFNTKEKKITMSINEAKSGGTLKSTHKIEEDLSDDQMEGSELIGEITLMVEGLREIASKYKGEFVVFKLVNCDNAVQLIDESSDFRYISAVIK